LSKAGLSIENKWTPQQHGKSNTAAQDAIHSDDEITQKNTKENLKLCENHLFILKKEDKNAKGWFFAIGEKELERREFFTQNTRVGRLLSLWMVFCHC
jgi:hypothetical protein